MFPVQVPDLTTLASEVQKRDASFLDINMLGRMIPSACDDNFMLLALVPHRLQRRNSFNLYFLLGAVPPPFVSGGANIRRSV